MPDKIIAVQIGHMADLDISGDRSDCAPEVANAGAGLWQGHGRGINGQKTRTR